MKGLGKTYVLQRMEFNPYKESRLCYIREIFRGVEVGLYWGIASKIKVKFLYFMPSTT